MNEEAIRILNKKETPLNNTQYQYRNEDTEKVFNNPEEYIIPECLPACKSLWDKNIETYMVSNYGHDGQTKENLWVLFNNLSNDNMEIMKQKSEIDTRFYYDGYYRKWGIRVEGNDMEASKELMSLVDVLKIQDTLRYQNADDFLESYKYTDGEYYHESDGSIHIRKNPLVENATLEEALEKTGKSSLYVASEDRIYDSPFYLTWHNRYLESLNNTMSETISNITPNKSNVDGDIAHLRDIYLTAEREYVEELLKSEGMQDLISEINGMNPDKLFAIAKDITEKVEMNLIPEEEMEMVEKRLIVILAAIQDKILKKDLILIQNGGKTR